MKKSKIILIVIYIVVAALVLYFAYGVVKNRYFAPANNIETKNSKTQDQINQPTDGSESINQENNAPESTAPATENGQPVFENADCASDCLRFKNIPDGLKYCQEACGERPVAPKESEGQCENLAGLEKNACWRDLAVSKKDIDICAKISDAKLQKVCRNRVTEEILN